MDGYTVMVEEGKMWLFVVMAFSWQQRAAAGLLGGVTARFVIVEV